MSGHSRRHPSHARTVFLPVLLVLSYLVVFSECTNYYVNSINGQDLNSGVSGSPWQTLNPMCTFVAVDDDAHLVLQDVGPHTLSYNGNCIVPFRTISCEVTNQPCILNIGTSSYISTRPGLTGFPSSVTFDKLTINRPGLASSQSETLFTTQARLLVLNQITASLANGAILSSSGTVHVLHSNFSVTDSTQKLFSSTGRLDFNNSRITDSVANAMISASNILNVYQSSFVNNNATGLYNAIDAFNAIVSISGSSFISNGLASALFQAQIVSIRNSGTVAVPASVTGNLFRNNLMSSSGASPALKLDQARYTVSGNTFDGNSATHCPDVYAYLSVGILQGNSFLNSRMTAESEHFFDRIGSAVCIVGTLDYTRTNVVANAFDLASMRFSVFNEDSPTYSMRTHFAVNGQAKFPLLGKALLVGSYANVTMKENTWNYLPSLHLGAVVSILSSIEVLEDSVGSGEAFVPGWVNAGSNLILRSNLTLPMAGFMFHIGGSDSIGTVELNGHSLIIESEDALGELVGASVISGAVMFTGGNVVIGPTTEFLIGPAFPEASYIVETPPTEEVIFRDANLFLQSTHAAPSRAPIVILARTPTPLVFDGPNKGSVFVTTSGAELLVPRPTSPFIHGGMTPSIITADVIMTNGILRVVDLTINGNLHLSGPSTYLEVAPTRFRNINHGLVVSGSVTSQAPARYWYSAGYLFQNEFVPNGALNVPVPFTDIGGSSNLDISAYGSSYSVFKLESNRTNPNILRAIPREIQYRGFFSPDGLNRIYKFDVPARDMLSISPNCTGFVDMSAINNQQNLDYPSLSCYWLDRYSLNLYSKKLPTMADFIFMQTPPIVYNELESWWIDDLLPVILSIAPVPSPIITPHNIVLDGRGSMFLSNAQIEWQWTVQGTDASNPSALMTFLASQTTQLISVPFDLFENEKSYSIRLDVNNAYSSVEAALVTFVVNTTAACPTDTFPFRILVPSSNAVAYEGIVFEATIEYESNTNCPVPSNLVVEWTLEPDFNTSNNVIGVVYSNIFSPTEDTIYLSSQLFYDDLLVLKARVYSSVTGANAHSYQAHVSVQFKAAPVVLELVSANTVNPSFNQIQLASLFPQAQTLIEFLNVTLVDCPNRLIEFTPIMQWYPDPRPDSTYGDTVLCGDPFSYGVPIYTIMTQQVPASPGTFSVTRVGDVGPGPHTFRVKYRVVGYYSGTTFKTGESDIVINVNTGIQTLNTVNIRPLISSGQPEALFASSAHRLVFQAVTSGACIDCSWEWYFPSLDISLSPEQISNPTLSIPRDSLPKNADVTIGVRQYEPNTPQRKSHQQSGPRPGDIFSYAEYTFHVSGAPSGGNFTASPLSLQAGVDNLTLEATGWVDTLSSLKYTYSITDDMGYEVPLVGTPGPFQGAVVQIPVFCPGRVCNMVVTMRVYNAIYSYSSRSITVEVHPPPVEKTFNDPTFYLEQTTALAHARDARDLPQLFYLFNLVAFHAHAINMTNAHPNYADVSDLLRTSLGQMTPQGHMSPSLSYTNLISQSVLSIARSDFIFAMGDPILIKMYDLLSQVPSSAWTPLAGEVNGVILGNLLESLNYLLRAQEIDSSVLTGEVDLAGISALITNSVFQSTYTGEPRYLYNSSTMAYSSQKFTLDAFAPAEYSFSSGTSTIVSFNPHEIDPLSTIIGPDKRIGVAHHVFKDGSFLAQFPAGAVYREVSRVTFESFYYAPVKKDGQGRLVEGTKRNGLANVNVKTTVFVPGTLLQETPACALYNTMTKQWETDVCSTRVGGSNDVNCACDARETKSDMTILFGSVFTDLNKPGVGRKTSGGISAGGIVAAVIVPLVFIAVAAVVLVNLFIPKWSCGPFKRYHMTKASDSVKMGQMRS